MENQYKSKRSFPCSLVCNLTCSSEILLASRSLTLKSYNSHVHLKNKTAQSTLVRLSFETRGINYTLVTRDKSITVDREDFKTITIQHNSLIPEVQNWKTGILSTLPFKRSKEASPFSLKGLLI